MRDVREGLVYDTEKATKLGTMESNNSFMLRRTLYRTKQGRFFTLNEYPGAKTFVSRMLSGDRPSDPRIIPLTRGEARELVWRWGLDFELAGLEAPEEA